MSFSELHFTVNEDEKEELTRQRKQDKEINDQHRPEDRDIEYREPCTHETDSDCSRRRMPELEFG